MSDSNWSNWTVDVDGDVFLEVGFEGMRFGLVFCKNEESGIFAMARYPDGLETLEEKIPDGILESICKVLSNRKIIDNGKT